MRAHAELVRGRGFSKAADRARDTAWSTLTDDDSRRPKWRVNGLADGWHLADGIPCARPPKAA